MFTITELPRQDGVVCGAFRVRHKSPSFDLEGYGFKFIQGLTAGPVQGRVADRLHAAFGADVTFEPSDANSAWMALQWMRQQGHPAGRVQRVEAMLSPSQTVAQVATPEAQPPTKTVPAQSSVPTTNAELMALTEAQLRAICDEMGDADKRWGVQRMRSFIAKELGIEGA